MSRALAVVVAAVVLFAGLPARADLPADKQALVLLRVLAYDKNLARRAGTKVVIAVVHADSVASRRAAAALVTALEVQIGRHTVADRELAVVLVPYSPRLSRVLIDSGASAVFVSSGLERALVDLARACREAGCLSFTETAGYLGRGVSIGLGLDARRTRIQISVDLVAARAEGAKLSSELLRVAQVIRR